MEQVKEFSGAIRIRGYISTGRVWINETEVTPERSRKFADHSDSFEWGSQGEGSCQLALAILLELVDESVARASYQIFNQEIVSQFNGGRDFGFVLPPFFRDIWTQRVARIRPGIRTDRDRDPADEWIPGGGEGSGF